MKLVEMKCKNCCSKLEVDSEAKEVTCNYCGTIFKIDDEIQRIKYEDMEQAGYEFEKGKIRAQQEYHQQQYQALYSNTYLDDEKNAALDLIITIFLGMLGVHKFMRGNIGMGFLYLFTAGIFGFGWAYDTIKALIRVIAKK